MVECLSSMHEALGSVPNTACTIWNMLAIPALGSRKAGRSRIQSHPVKQCCGAETGLSLCLGSHNQVGTQSQWVRPHFLTAATELGQANGNCGHWPGSNERETLCGNTEVKSNHTRTSGVNLWPPPHTYTFSSTHVHRRITTYAPPTHPPPQTHHTRSKE